MSMIVYLFLFLGTVALLGLIWSGHELYKSAKKNNWVIE